MDGESNEFRGAGGTVQPANWPTIAKQRLVEPESQAPERYELRDPVAEVTYRAKTFAEMVLQAERLGASRFDAVAPDGSRTPVARKEGEWKRPDPPAAQRSLFLEEKVQRTAQKDAMAPPPADLEGLVAGVEAKAAQAARMTGLERELRERYVIKRASVKVRYLTVGQTEYRYRSDTTRIAFTESAFKLSTDNNDPSVARSMVDVSEARRWNALRVSGHENFRRIVWLEASLRGINTIGYEPNHVDKELLRRERDVHQINKIEPAHMAQVDGTGASKQSGRGSGSRKAVLAALEAVLVAKRVPARQREAVLSAAADNLAARLRNGEVHKVKVFDRSAPAQQPLTRPTREIERTHDRAPPSR
jgi:hypothetical protein